MKPSDGKSAAPARGYSKTLNKEESEMNEQKGLLTRLGETLDQYRAERRGAAQEQMPSRRPGWLRSLLPTPGNVLFTLLVVAGLLWANSVGALPLRAPAAAGTSTGTIAYQGRLADADGNPITDTVNMEFRLYDVASGGVPLWEEQWTGSNGVQVSDGLFNVMLGSLTSIPQSVITGHDSLFLGITVGTDDEMTPRVQLGTVPFAVQALMVPDGSVTTEKIADEAVTQAKLGADVSLVPPDGSITTEKLADDAVTSAKIAHTFGASNREMLNIIFQASPTKSFDNNNGKDVDWTDLDLTSATSPTAVAAYLRLYAYDPDSPNAYIAVRKKGHTNGNQVKYCYASTEALPYEPGRGGVYVGDCMVWVEMDSSQVIQYKVKTAIDQDGSYSAIIVHGWAELAHQ
jgi:hypothetical protein